MTHHIARPLAGLCLTATMALGAAQAAVQAGPSYRIDIVPKQHGLTPTAALAINNLGVVVGYADVRGDSRSCFRYEQGKVTLMQGSRLAYCSEINDAGEVAGTAQPDGKFMAAMWTADGALHLLGPDGSQGLAINSAHQVAGYVSVGGYTHAALFANGAVTDLHALGQASVAESINSAGKVVGHFIDASGHSRAFAWQDGVMREICKVDGAISSYANAVNHKGQALCAATAANYDDLTFIEDEDGTQHPVPGVHGHELLPFRMNNFGENVGRGFPHLTAYYSTGSKSYDLMKLVTVNAADWTKLLFARDINRSGQIVGWGRSSSGPKRAYIATPVSAH